LYRVELLEARGEYSSSLFSLPSPLPMIYFTTLLLSVSLTIILVRSKLTESFRSAVMKRYPPNGVTWGYLVNCPQCSGVWVGLVCAVCYIPLIASGAPFRSVFEVIHFVAVVTFGTSLGALLADTYLFK